MRKQISFLFVLLLIFLAVIIFYNEINDDIITEKKIHGTSRKEKNPALSSATGKKFSGDAVRKFGCYHKDKEKYEKIGDKTINCAKWGVLTTIYGVSEAVRRQVKLKNWCLVIVADRNSVTQNKYDTGWFEGQGNDHVVYLTTHEQENFGNSFVQKTPWNHFGRKNIGYLYAIQHGADVIWDFDDDNILKFWIEGAAPPKAPCLDYEIDNGIGDGDIISRMPREHDYPTYNPYPVLGAPTLPSWPRGLPLDDIKEKRSFNSTLDEIKIHRASVGVLQSLADVQPDVDAIYRLTMKIPFSFNRLKETRPLVVPHGVLTPYNAQATLHFKRAFWGLFLPVTVNGRVSDIWRSYIVQRLFWDCDLYLAFSARPLVVQNRNPHNYIQDMAAENDLYMKSKQLVTFLGKWKSDADNLIDRIRELWEALYERDYINEDDVKLVNSWLNNLVNIGYQFPSVLKNEHDIPQYELDQIEDKLNEETCEPPETLTFWTSDLHDGSRSDVPTILATQGHNVILGGLKRSFLPNKHVLDFKGISVSKNMSSVIKSYRTHSTNLTEKMVIENFNFFKHDQQIAKTDAFVCQFPASMCELWMPFNKSIIFNPAHRYNLARCTKTEWDRLNKHLRMLASSPEHVIAAQSLYDKEYLEHYTGINVTPLHSYSGYYTAIATYNATRKVVPVVCHGYKHFTDKAKNKKFKLVPLSRVYSHYEFSNLVHYPAIVYIPYSVMSYKLTEFYALGIPLFMPSMKFFHAHGGLGRDRTSVSRPYCSNPNLDNEMKPHPNSIHVYSPNSDSDAESEYYWLQMSDFFYWPHITYFDSLSDLEKKLEQADLHAIHRYMTEELEKKRKFVSEKWCEVSQKIKSGKRVPQDYKDAILNLFNVSRLQVM